MGKENLGDFMISIEAALILVISALGFPLMFMETRKFPQMRYMLLGYLCIIVATAFAIVMTPGKANVIALARSVSVMAAGLFFGAGAFISYKRMEKVIK